LAYQCLNLHVSVILAAKVRISARKTKNILVFFAATLLQHRGAWEAKKSHVRNFSGRPSREKISREIFSREAALF